MTHGSAVAKGVLANAAPSKLLLAWGAVTATATGPARVSVQLSGLAAATPNIRYLAGYSPTVGDTVAVLCVPTAHGVDFLCLGKTA